MSYTLTQKEFASLKSRLTRAENKKREDPEKLLSEATRALAVFEEKGFPDAWHRWQRAKEDAEYLIRQRPG